MKRSRLPLKARMRLTVRSSDGEIIEQREASNIVLHQGARLVAHLFSGKPETSPINRVRVGFGREGGDPGLTALSNPENLPDAALQTQLGPDAFEIRDEDRIVAVAINARFRPTVDLKGVTEAGLAADAELYNQVVFEPVDLRVEEDITFFWEVEFPFGR